MSGVSERAAGSVVDVGEALPTMPLSLAAEQCVPVDLEAMAQGLTKIAQRRSS